MDYLWEVKNVVNKVKHVVLNLTEMEGRVMEATNGDKWGASSTDMQVIAQGTFHFQHFNEIMGILIKRLSERDPLKWRSVYKALTLLEYLIKNGSEKVVDFGRSHLALLKSLKTYHCIDDKNKDQGINVKNRSKEIVELLNSTERIQTERKLAKSNKAKYVGIASNQVHNFSGTNHSYGSRTGTGSNGSNATVAPYNFNQPDLDTLNHRFGEKDTAYSFEQYTQPNNSKQLEPLPPPPIDLLSLDLPPTCNNNLDEGWGEFETVAQPAGEDLDTFGEFQSVTSITDTNTNTNTNTITNANNITNTNTTAVLPTIPTSLPSTQLNPTSKPSSDPFDLMGDLQSISFTNPQLSTTDFSKGKNPSLIQPLASCSSSLQNTATLTTNPPQTPLKKELWQDFDKLVNLDDLKLLPQVQNQNQVKTMDQLKKDISSPSSLHFANQSSTGGINWDGAKGQGKNWNGLDSLI